MSRVQITRGVSSIRVFYWALGRASRKTWIFRHATFFFRASRRCASLSWGVEKEYNMVVQCPYCRHKEMVPEEYAGMQGECSKCGRDYLLQKLDDAISHPVICFLLGFFFSIIGIVVAYIIDKKNVTKAIIGVAVSLMLWLFIVCGATCVSAKTVSVEGLSMEAIIEHTKQSRRAGLRAAAAASALSEEEGDSAKSAVESISEDTIRQIGEE